MSASPQRLTPAAVTLEALRSSPKLTFNATEAATILGLDPRTVRRACQAGQLPSFKVGALVLIPRDGLLRLLENGAA